MIVIDTHVWVWWVHGHESLLPRMRQCLQDHEADGIGVNSISVWEVARLVAVGRLDLSRPIERWLEQALDYPGVRVIDLTPAICVEANNLPGEFHKDPADRIIVASGRVTGSELLTADQRILDYPHVSLSRAPNPPRDVQ